MLFQADLTQPDQAARIVDEFVAFAGRLDILVNNAGEQHYDKDIRDISEEQLKRTFQTNIFGMFFLTQAALPHLEKAFEKSEIRRQRALA